MHSHLITVKVSVEGSTYERVYLDRFTFNQHRLEGLDAQTVKRRRAVQKHRMLANHFFEDVPNNRLLPLHHFLSLLDRCCVLLLLEQVVDKRLEQLQRHFLRQATLMQLKLGADHDHRTAGVIHTLAQKILSEPALFSFKRIRKRFERPVISASQHAAATSIVE